MNARKAFQSMVEFRGRRETTIIFFLLLLTKSFNLPCNIHCCSSATFEIIVSFLDSFEVITIAK